MGLVGLMVLGTCTYIISFAAWWSLLKPDMHVRIGTGMEKL